MTTTFYEFLLDCAAENPAIKTMMDHAGSSVNFDEVGVIAQALTQEMAPLSMHNVLRAAYAEFLASSIPATEVIEQSVAPEEIDMTSGEVNADGYAEYKGEDGRVWTDIRKESDRDDGETVN